MICTQTNPVGEVTTVSVEQAVIPSPAAWAIGAPMRGVFGYLVGKAMKTESSPEGRPLAGVVIGILFGFGGVGVLAGYELWKNRKK